MNRNVRRLMIRSWQNGQPAHAPAERGDDPLPETLLKQTVQTAVELAKTKAPASTVLSHKVSYLVEATEASMTGDGLFTSSRTPFYYGSWPLWLAGRCFGWLWSRACKGRSCVLARRASES
ncbi:MAG: hypothetical protein AB7K24_34480 [Gemmataceae bacterium]